MSDRNSKETSRCDGSAETLLQFSNEEKDYHGPKHTSPKSAVFQWFKVAKQIILFALASWGAFSIIYWLISQHSQTDPGVTSNDHLSQKELDSQPGDRHHPEYQTPLRKSCACGNSTMEAIAMGCIYDSLSPAWLQRHCIDHSLTTEFESSGDGPNGSWLYWADRSHTIPLTLHEVSLLADDPTATFHVGWKWHVVHCSMYWIKLWRSVKGQVQMENRYDNEKHIRHCLDTFFDEAWGTSSSVVLDADYFVF